MPIVSELILSLMLTASLSAGAPLSAPPGLAVSLPAITAQAQQLHTPLMILHAGGVTPEGVTGSNSLEALEHSYENGFRLLELDFSADEDVVCIAENDACGVDAIQVLLGCSVGKGNLLFNLGNGLTNEVGASLRRVSDTEFEGTRLLGTFCYNPQAVFPMYFVVRVNKKPAAYGMWKKQPAFGNAQAQWDSDQGKYKLYPGYGRDMAGNDIGYYMSYDCAEGEQVEVQVGVSFVSIANARENLNAEQKGFEFENVVKEGHDEWARTLDRVTVEGGTEDQRRVFYTALYHTQIHPTVLQDVNGEYPKMESNENGNAYLSLKFFCAFTLSLLIPMTLYPSAKNLS